MITDSTTTNQRGDAYCRSCGEDDHDTRECPWSTKAVSGLVALHGQPLCKYYTGAKISDLKGDYVYCCDAGVPYDRWTPDMGRWPCRRKHILGLEQHVCHLADYGSTGLTKDVDAQLTEMMLRAIGGQNSVIGSTQRLQMKSNQPTHQPTQLDAYTP